MDFFKALASGIQPKLVTSTSNYDPAMTDARGNITWQLEGCPLLVREKPPLGGLSRHLTLRAVSEAREAFLSSTSVFIARTIGQKQAVQIPGEGVCAHGPKFSTLK